MKIEQGKKVSAAFYCVAGHAWFVQLTAAMSVEVIDGKTVGARLTDVENGIMLERGMMCQITDTGSLVATYHVDSIDRDAGLVRMTESADSPLQLL